MSDEQWPISLSAITSAAENAKNHDKFAVIRSDDDYQYARTHDAALTLADEMRAEINVTGSIRHTVQIIELVVSNDE